MVFDFVADRINKFCAMAVVIEDQKIKYSITKKGRRPFFVIPHPLPSSPNLSVVIVRMTKEEGMIGLSLEFQPQEHAYITTRPEGALRSRTRRRPRPRIRPRGVME